MFNLKELLGFIKLMKRNSRLYAVALILSSIAYPSMYILYAFVNKELIRAVTQKDLSILYNVFILIFLIIAGSCIIDPIGCYVRGYTVRKIINEIREDVINHLLEMPLSYFETHDTGKLMSILSNDLNIVEDAFRNCVRMVIVTTVMAIGSLISIYILEWRLFIVAIILGVLFFLSNTIFC
ncbi:ABC transporter transmembrane domain-containing protein [Cellulosilyticum ruminicola]|uniref:ABC transporter transmembrane domain-containing protein n=1 Tax=Cellulosilyticum ruminicola TaxID=425254 RepID=UPI0006CFEDA8|nr:ABC transporter transmembrane domain-containing protein [Cellulosilyticum ruminicola]